MLNHNDNFYRTSEKENALDYLDKLQTFCQFAQKDRSYLKWVLLALHATLYNLMLLALMKSDMSGIWKKELRTERGLIDVNDNRIRVVDFLTAFRWIQDQARMKKNITSKSFNSNKEIDQAMERLNDEFRNQFVHYKPIGWSIEIKLIREILDKTVPILRFLTFDSGNVLFDGQSKRVISKILDRVVDIKE